MNLECKEWRQPKAEALSEWFQRTDTPASQSPTGILIVKLVERYPDMELAEARVQANYLLGRAAGKHVYRFPVVLTAEQEDAQRQKLAAMRSKKSQTAPQNSDSSHLERRPDEGMAA